MKAYFIAILTLFTCIATVVRAQQMSELENRIDSLLNGKKATVGIAVWTDKGDMLRYNDHVHFPLLSVFKFHVALAVLDKMDKQSISLDSIVSIKASQMLPNTYSPLRKKFPDQDFTITLRELMQYSISQSDNNACDILIEYAGGIKHINDYICRLSIDSFNLSEKELIQMPSFGLLSERPESEIKSGRFVLDTLWAAIWCVEKTTNYRYAVLKAVDLGDDSDTTASVAGGIAGLIYGIGGEKGVPSNWIEQLACRNWLEDAAEKTAEMTC